VPPSGDNLSHLLVQVRHARRALVRRTKQAVWQLLANSFDTSTATISDALILLCSGQFSQINMPLSLVLSTYFSRSPAHKLDAAGVIIDPAHQQITCAWSCSQEHLILL
jgi:hypothetical protein